MHKLDDLVRADQGLVRREIFADPALYRQELERIFDRSWLFLAHTPRSCPSRAIF